MMNRRAFCRTVGLGATAAVWAGTTRVRAESAPAGRVVYGKQTSGVLEVVTADIPATNLAGTEDFDHTIIDEGYTREFSGRVETFKFQDNCRIHLTRTANEKTRPRRGAND